MTALIVKAALVEGFRISNAAVVQKPAMTHVAELVIVKFHPGEMTEATALFIESSSWNTGRIQEHRASPIAVKGAAFSLASLEAMVHMPKHHQLRRALMAQTVEG